MERSAWVSHHHVLDVDWAQACNRDAGQGPQGPLRPDGGVVRGQWRRRAAHRPYAGRSGRNGADAAGSGPRVRPAWRAFRLLASGTALRLLRPLLDSARQALRDYLAASVRRGSTIPAIAIHASSGCGCASSWWTWRPRRDGRTAGAAWRRPVPRPMPCLSAAAASGSACGSRKTMPGICYAPLAELLGLPLALQQRILVAHRPPLWRRAVEARAVGTGAAVPLAWSAADRALHAGRSGRRQAQSAILGDAGGGADRCRASDDPAMAASPMGRTLRSRGAGRLDRHRRPGDAAAASDASHSGHARRAYPRGFAAGNTRKGWQKCDSCRLSRP